MLITNFLSIKIVTIAVCVLTIVNSTQAQDITKIAFVSTERIFRDAMPAKIAQTKLKQEFVKREKDIQDIAVKLKNQSEKLNRDAAILSESDRIKRHRALAELDKDFQRKQREFREDLNQRRNEELSIVLERTNKVIRKIAENEKYDIIFQDAVYANKRIDITDKVINELAK